MYLYNNVWTLLKILKMNNNYNNFIIKKIYDTHTYVFINTVIGLIFDNFKR